MYGRRHYTHSQTPTPHYEWKPSIKVVEPVNHDSDRIIGTKKIITSYTIVKPRVERVHFVEKSSSTTKNGSNAPGASLEDFMSGKMFL